MRLRIIEALILGVAMLGLAGILAAGFELANRADCPAAPYLSRCAAYR